MPEWWTYTLTDFLMFSPRAYARLIERYNASVWPGQLAGCAAAVALLGMALRPAPRRNRMAAALLAAGWGWVGYGFFWARYADINLAARYFAGLFVAEAVLLAWLGGDGGRDRPRAVGGLRRLAGTLLMALAIAFPLLAPMLGRGWRHAEVFGVMPEPTAIATVGWLLAVGGRARGVALAAPLLWCVIGGLTLSALGAPEAAGPALTLALAGLALARATSAT